MVTLTKYGAKYNRLILHIEGLSTDLPKPTVYFYEYDDTGREISRLAIQNGSIFTEVDTGKNYMYDAENTTWYEVTIGGGGGASGGIILVGTTTTQLTDGATTNPITVDGQSYTAQPNDAVIYGNKEFLFDGTYWHEFGDMSGLGSAAYKDVPTSGDASTTQVVMGNDTRIGSIAGIKAVTDRIIMDGTETQDYYFQDSTPSNPSSGDYWFSDEPIVSSDVTAMTGYAKAQTAADVSASDSLNVAVGKIEYKVDVKQNEVLGSWTAGTETSHSTPTGSDTVLQALQKIDNNQRNDENNISSLQQKVVAHTAGGSNYDTINGIRVYVDSNPPTGARVGDLWIGG
jgi:hypothetical protein